MEQPGRGLRLGFIEPHLRCFGGIRRMLEFANRLHARGHDVTFYLPATEEPRCTWMRCDAVVKPIPAGFDDELDVILFNHEPQWHLLQRFERARRRVFYALHYAHLYAKEGSWESLRAPVDLQLANSNWTADQILAETGSRPTVQLGGVNRDTFHPGTRAKPYPLLCSGEKHRAWKGTATVLEAGRLARVPVRRYAGKNLDQHALGREYAAARVFAVGSWYEGFCQPGLEALACGTPLVTTDNGGCREYALDGETALVVPPRDARAMAGAIRTLLDDGELAAKLAANGLDLVAADFDWDKRTAELEEVLDGLVAGPAPVAPPVRPAAPPAPELSVVVAASDKLLTTQQFVESARRNTDVPYQLVIVDRGSDWEAANYARAAADTVACDDRNAGHASAMNHGLQVAEGDLVAFCDTEAVLPESWAARLVETARAHPNAAIVVPAVTAARDDVTVRAAPSEAVETVPPFSLPPPAIVYLARPEVLRRLGGWDEEHEIASGEGFDLCFTAWTNDLDVVCDRRVLVAHDSKPRAPRRGDSPTAWAHNRRRFLDKWARDAPVPRLPSCDPARFERNRAIARAAADWLDRYFIVLDREDQRSRRLFGRNGPVRTRPLDWAHHGWRRVRPKLPAGVADRLGAAARRVER
jgi:GT2 family glycosyltransferase